jgi:signal transduction histidine kinase
MAERGAPSYRLRVTNDEGETAGARPLQGPPHLGGVSAALPLVVGVVQVVGTLLAGHDQTGRRPFDVVAVLLLVAGPVALTQRRRYPVATYAFVFATTLAYLLLDYPRGPIFIALILAFVALVMSGRRLLAAASGVVGYVAFLWLPALLGERASPELAEALGLAAWLILLFTLAEVGRTRRERALEGARTRAEEARRRASEERLRIARELHDALAHNISLISVQAGVALHLIDDKPEQARTALTAIKQASNEALGELRSVLDVLRRGEDQPPRAPTSGLAHLDDLVARTESAALAIEVRVEGVPRPLPVGVDFAAYRIVQEALTNVTRHAGPATAVVTIAYGEGDLVVQVEDDGRGAPPGGGAPGGRGIDGMRERAAALGGELRAGPRSGGGFRVWARLPLPEDARA